MATTESRSLCCGASLEVDEKRLLCFCSNCGRPYSAIGLKDNALNKTTPIIRALIRGLKGTISLLEKEMERDNKEEDKDGRSTDGSTAGSGRGISTG